MTMMTNYKPLEREMGKPFGLSMKPNDKMDWFLFIKLSIDAYISSKNYNGEIPNKIYVNPKQIGFLGNAKGVMYMGHKIPVMAKRDCIVQHIQLHS